VNFEVRSRSEKLKWEVEMRIDKKSPSGDLGAEGE